MIIFLVWGGWINFLFGLDGFAVRVFGEGGVQNLGVFWGCGVFCFISK